MTTESKPKTRPLNTRRIPASEEAKRFCAYVCARIEGYENTYGTRKRRRKPTDQKTFERTISTIICDVLHHSIAYVWSGKGKTAVNAPDGIRVSLSNKHLGRKTEDGSPAMPKTLPSLISCLAKCGFLDVTAGTQGCRGFKIPPQQTALRPTRHLIDLARGKKHAHNGDVFGITGLEHFTTDNEGRESIFLRAPKEKPGSEESGEIIPYKDTRKTRHYRAEMASINEWLTHAPITCGIRQTTDKKGQRQAVDPQKRFLWRTFTQADKGFQSGGRLWGGFWQDLSTIDRLKGMTIAGERVCILDYGQMGPLILYGMCDRQPQLEDCYTIQYYEDHRDRIKKIFNAALFGKLNRYPKNTRPKFPPRIPFDRIKSAILKAHWPVAHHLFTEDGPGHEIQYRESTIMVALLIALKEAGLPAALPIHDAVIVPASWTATARNLMEKTFKEHTGIAARISVESWKDGDKGDMVY